MVIIIKQILFDFIVSCHYNLRRLFNAKAHLVDDLVWFGLVGLGFMVYQPLLVI